MATPTNAYAHPTQFLDQFLSQWDSIHSHAVRHAYGYSNHPCSISTFSSSPCASRLTPKRSRADSGLSESSSDRHSMSPPSSPLSPMLPSDAVLPTSPPQLILPMDGSPNRNTAPPVGPRSSSTGLSTADMMKLVQQQAHQQLVQQLQLAQLNTLFHACAVSPSSPLIDSSCPPLLPASDSSTFLHSNPCVPPSSPVLSNTTFTFDTLPVEKYISIPLSEQECMEANLLFDQLITMDDV